VDLTEQSLEAGPGIFDHRDRPCQRGGLARQQLGDQEIEIHG
jgi:hypothetical protein